MAVAVIAIGTVAGASAGGYLILDSSRATTVSFNLRDGQTEVPLDQALVFKTSRPTPLGEMRNGLRITTGNTGAAVLPASAAATAPPPGATPGPSPTGPLGVAAEGQLRAAPDGRTFTWTPSAPFLDVTPYTVRVTPAHDSDGHRVVAGRWRFTTTLVPRVLGVTTDSGATVAENSELGINTNLQVNFNTAMEQASVRIMVNTQPAQVSWDPAAKVAALSLKGVPVGPVDLTLGPGGRDSMGRILPTNWDLKASVVFRPNIRTAPLPYPAVVQIPNDNYGARDQSGLSAADFVYEYDTEGNITRLSAVFASSPDTVGPVRSARLASISLAHHYGARLFASGMSQGTFGRLLSDPVPTGLDGEASYFRSNNRTAPNNLYITAANIQKSEAATQGSNAQIKKAPVGTFNGDPAPGFGVPDHDSTYTYDPTTGTYTKTESGRLMNDALIGQPVRISMVVVMHTAITTTNIVEDSNGARGLDFDLQSGGRAEFYYQGKKATGKWSSPDRNSGFVFTLDSGQQLNMPSGVVWVDLVG